MFIIFFNRSSQIGFLSYVISYFLMLLERNFFSSTQIKDFLSLQFFTISASGFLESGSRKKA